VRAAGNGDGRSGSEDLLTQVLARDNMRAALGRVKRNGGSAGVDGMTVDELPGYLKQHWPRIREEILAGRYRPQQVLRREIPKNGGGVRELGIPTVLDRLVQQAILQVLQPRFDPSFSDHSYGFRPGRRAHEAVCRAQQYIQGGRRVVVDIDLERFFDRVNHDVLMERLARRVADRRLLRLIRRYLEAGVMVQGVAAERHEGTPQGGPLSPLLANVLLDEVDKELEKRGHAFVRYADDCNVYVQSRRAGERVMQSLRRLYAGLRLRINEAKSAVAPAWNRKFLGYSFWVARGKAVKRRVADKAIATMKDRVRSITARNGGRSMSQVAAQLRSYLTGWKAYFRLAETPKVFAELDEWIRHRMRTLQLKQWKRGKTIYRELRARGMSQLVAATVAANARRWVWNSRRYLHLAIRNTDLDALGVPRLAA
jgi:group II intron reverse transcriptase/maturase